MSSKDEAEREYMSKVPYANIVGSLLYAMVCTRPDISQLVGVINRYMHNPGKEHWQAVKWILRYIHNTVDVGLVFEQECNQSVVGYCDSGFAGDLINEDQLLSTVILSTTVAEYMSITEAVKEAI
ncbi:secreted RxLR effector protein 161-like [Nicotiana sylvestris]|uniref:secreted RxLR effector protein 161-like n=1 Tax=Nicotiana sylvestris TaxID=4096 RepID=UPI00388C7956